MHFVTKYGETPTQQNVTYYEDSSQFDGHVGYYTTGYYSHIPTMSSRYANFVGWFYTETFEDGTKGEIVPGYNQQTTYLTVPKNEFIFSNDEDIYVYAKWEPTEEHVYNAADLQNIADAIREVGGTTGTLKPGEFNMALINALVVPMPSFIINHGGWGTHIYNFDEGMTWAEFVESEYNTGDRTLSVANNYVWFGGVGSYIVSYEGSAVSPNDTIISDEQYGCYYGG